MTHIDAALKKIFSALKNLFSFDKYNRYTLIYFTFLSSLFYSVKFIHCFQFTHSENLIEHITFPLWLGTIYFMMPKNNVLNGHHTLSQIEINVLESFNRKNIDKNNFYFAREHKHKSRKKKIKQLNVEFCVFEYLSMCVCVFISFV